MPNDVEGHREWRAMLCWAGFAEFEKLKDVERAEGHKDGLRFGKGPRFSQLRRVEGKEVGRVKGIGRVRELGRAGRVENIREMHPRASGWV